MIVFATNADTQTAGSFEVAKQLSQKPCTAILSDNATRANLISALSKSRSPLFALGHGQPHHLEDQTGNAAVGVEDVHLFSNRPAFAFACHTGTTLGGHIAKSGGIWWGFTGPVSAPPSNPKLIPIYVDLFEYIYDNFPAFSSPSLYETFLNALQELCENAKYALDDLLEEDDDFIEPLMCIENLWDRLRVWLPGDIEPRRHAHSTSRFLFTD